MKAEILRTAERLVAEHTDSIETETRWRRPLVSFAAAGDPAFVSLKESVGPGHLLPGDILATARTVVVYFAPFERSIVESNVGGRSCSRDWAVAYRETNELLVLLGDSIRELLEARGHKAATTAPTHNFDRELLISDWSHRHVARIAGLGGFGLNNMLITAAGCCGRLGSLVTDAVIEADAPLGREACLYRDDGSCGACVASCVNSALFVDRFDRHRCYEMCLENAALWESPGKADVCGKCLVGLPCSLVDPVSARGGGS